MSGRDEGGYREELEARSGVRLLEAQWNYLLKHGYIRDVLRGDETCWTDAVKEARDLVEAWRAGGDAEHGSAFRSGRKPEPAAPQEVRVELHPDTRRRSAVLMELLELHPDIRRFRERFSGWPFSEEQVSEFLEGKDRAHRRLQKLAERIARHYAWSKRQAARFLLTGHAPEPVSVAVSLAESTHSYVPNMARITVTAEAWVTGQEVEAAFKAAQRQLLGSSRNRTGGSRGKRPNRTLEVARFVAAQVRACYEPAKRMPVACRRKRQANATKCKPPRVSGSLS